MAVRALANAEPIRKILEEEVVPALKDRPESAAHVLPDFYHRLTALSNLFHSHAAPTLGDLPNPVPET